MPAVSSGMYGLGSVLGDLVSMAGALLFEALFVNSRESMLSLVCLVEILSGL